MTTRSSLPSRRTLLHTLTLGAGGLATLGSWNRDVRNMSLLPGTVRAAISGPPKRLLIFFTINGIRPDSKWNDWLLPGATETSFTFSDITKPAERHRDQLVFFDGMIYGTKVDFGNTHWTGTQVSLTGANMVSKTDPTKLQGDLGRPDGPSIDVFLGAKIGAVATPKWPSLQMNLCAPGEASNVSRTETGQELPAFHDPWDVYGKMFGSIGTSQAAPDPSLLRRVMMRQSVLDAVSKDVGDLRRRLPREDRDRMDAQLDAIRTLEARLAQGSGNAAGAGCSKPSLPTAVPDVHATKVYPQVLHATSDLVVSAMACDLTRFAMIGWRISGRQDPSDFDPINSPYQEHAMSHDHMLEFGQLKSWYMSEFANVLDKLKAIPEPGPNGTMGTMLDNTIVLWATEQSIGHTHTRMPWMTAGGRNLGVNTGRCLKLPVIYDNGFPARSDKGYPHARLLLSFAHAMGLTDTKSFGIASLGNAPMDGYLKT